MSHPRPLSRRALHLALVFALGASAVVPASMHAQRDSSATRAPSPSPLQVRIWSGSPYPKREWFQLRAIHGDTLELYGVDAECWRCHRMKQRRMSAAEIVRLDVMTGQRDRAAGAGRGAIAGAGVGFLAGLVLGGVAASEGGMAGLALLFGPPIGAGVGLALGTIKGTAAPGKHWQTVIDHGRIAAGTWPPPALLTAMDSAGIAYAPTSDAVAETRTGPGGSLASAGAPSAVRLPAAARLAAGTRARVTVPAWDWSRRDVVIRALRDDSLHFTVGAGGRQTVTALPLDAVRRVEVPVGPGSRFDRAGRFALGGILVGAAVGGIHGVVDNNPDNQDTREFLGGAALGSIAGFLAGAIVGPMGTGQRWRDVPLGERTTSESPRQAR